MTTRSTGSQTEPPSPLGVVASASRTTAADLSAVESEAGGILVDDVGLIAAGLRLGDGDGCHGEPVTRHLVPARLWHGDAARRAERVDALRRLADVLEGDVPPTPGDLLDAMPGGWHRRLLELAAAEVLRRRVDEAAALSGLSDRRTFARANQSAVASVGRGPLHRLLNLIRAVAFTARRNPKH